MVRFTLLVLILEGKLLQKHGFGVILQIREQKRTRLSGTGRVEIDAEISPVSVRLLANIQVADCAHMESHKLLRVERNKNGFVNIVNVQLTFDQVSRDLLE